MHTYMCSVLNYGCESWTWNAAIYKKVDGFEKWCYWIILKVNCFDDVSNARSQTEYIRNCISGKTWWGGNWGMQDMFWEARADYHIFNFERSDRGKEKCGCSKKDVDEVYLKGINWNDKIRPEKKTVHNGMVKRLAEKKKRWKIIVVNLRNDGEDRWIIEYCYL